MYQGASRELIMECFDALESKARKELNYDEPTAEQIAATEARLHKVGTYRDIRGG